jgi:hypothetical protein
MSERSAPSVTVLRPPSDGEPILFATWSRQTRLAAHDRAVHL